MKNILAMTFVLLFVNCSGTTDETNSGICGKVTYVDGTPATSVSLKIFRDSAVVPLAQSRTAADGTFLFDALASGTYGIWAEDGDTGVAFAGAIVVPDKELVTRNLTLEKSSSLTAFVRLQGGENPKTVLVQTLGSDRTTGVDSAGTFILNGLAKGAYTLRLSTSIERYPTVYKPFTIASGIVDTLNDTILFTLVNPFPTNERLTALAYGNGRFVAVGYNRTIITSTDGNEWTMVSSSGRNLHAVTWGKNRFVAVGDSCETMSSGDGINWTASTRTGNFSSLHCVTYGNNLFVAAGFTGGKTVVLTSPDGSVWKEQSTNQTIPLNSLVYGNSTFVGAGRNQALVSSDGIEWTPYTIEPDTAASGIHAVIWGGSQFIAFGEAGSLFTSPDGKTWTKQNSRTDADLVSAVWQDNHYTVIGRINTSCSDLDSVTIATSSDGVNWVPLTGWTAPPASATVTALSYGAGVYVAIGENGLVTSSLNGISWKNRSSVTTEVLNDICWNAGQFIAVGKSGTIVASTNGSLWHLRPSGTTRELKAIACNDRCFLAVGAGGTICASANGTDWTLVPSPAPNDLSGIAWGNGRFVAVGEKRIIISSANGKEWDIALPSDDTLHATAGSGVAYGNSGFVVVNNRGEMFTSVDGLTWKTGNATCRAGYTGVAWGAGNYIVIEHTGTDSAFFLSSADGQTWTDPKPIQQAPFLTPRKIAWGANQFVLLDGSASSSSVYSADGTDWLLFPDPCAFGTFNAFAWDGTKYVFVGDGGAIWIRSRPF